MMILNYILSAIIIIQAIIHRVERWDMLNRLTCNSSNFPNKKGDTPPKHIPSAHDRTLNKWRNKVGEE